MNIFIFPCLCSHCPHPQRIFFRLLSLCESLAISTNYLESHLSRCLSYCISGVPCSPRLPRRPGAVRHSGVSFSSMLVGVRPHLPQAALQGCYMLQWQLPLGSVSIKTLDCVEEKPTRASLGERHQP